MSLRGTHHCAAVPRRARIQGSRTFVSLNSRLGSDNEEGEKTRSPKSQTPNSKSRRERLERVMAEHLAHTPNTLHPTPYKPHPIPYTLHPTTHTLHPYTLHPTPYTLHPTPYTLRPTPYTLHHKQREAGARDGGAPGTGGTAGKCQGPGCRGRCRRHGPGPPYLS